MEIKKKHLDRREWYTDSERDYSCLYHRDDYFQGGIGLITFTGLTKPDIVDTVEGPFCIADQGYRWLELAPEKGHFVLTAMFRDEQLFQQYIDITLMNNVAENGDTVFFDLFLDVVILSDGTPRIVDTEELDAALSDGIITRKEYDLARQTAEKVVASCNSENGVIRRKLYEYRALFNHVPCASERKEKA